MSSTTHLTKIIAVFGRWKQSVYVQGRARGREEGFKGKQNPYFWNSKLLFNVQEKNQVVVI